MTNQLTIISGPSGSGKTKLARRIRLHEQDGDTKVVIVDEAERNWGRVVYHLDAGHWVVAVFSGSLDINHIKLGQL